VTKNKGPAEGNKKKGVLGGKPLIGPLIGQKGTTQCGKARAIETSGIKGLDAEKLLISPSATLADARGGKPMSQLDSAAPTASSHRQGRPINIKFDKIVNNKGSFTDLFKPDLNLYVLTKTETSTKYVFKETTTVTFECTPKTSILDKCKGGPAPFDFIPFLGLGAPALPFANGR